MFLINSQIPFLRNSSSMLEPILLPKLQIYFAEFPYNPYIHAIAINSGYLLRYRYDYRASFSSEQVRTTKSPSSHNNPDTQHSQLCCSDYFLPPSVTVESPQHTIIYYYKSISVYTVDSLPLTEKPSSYTQIHSCYYYQDLHISPLHTRSRKSFNRIISPSYLT